MQKLIYLSSLLSLIIISTNCSKFTHQDKTEIPTESSAKEVNISDLKENISSCVCAQLWMPVCGENGKTYSNACFAKCAHMKYKMGSCEKNLIK